MASINASCSCNYNSQGWSWAPIATYATLVVSVALNVFFLWKRFSHKTAPVQSAFVPSQPSAVKERTLSHRELIEKLKADFDAVEALKARSSGEGVVKTSSPYDSLICDDEYIGFAIDVFGYLAENSYGSMIWNISKTIDTLSGIGKKMEAKGVHPLKLIELMGRDTKLKAAMKLIFKDSSKKGSVIDAPSIAKPLLRSKGLSCGIKDKLSRCDDLDKYFNGFVQALKLKDTEIPKVQSFFTTRNWEGLIQFLINR